MMNYKALLLIAVLGIAYTSCAQEDTAKPKVIKLPAGFTSQLNVVYKKAGNWEGKMDLYLPPNSNQLTPVVFIMHGGAWRKGTKEGLGGFDTYFRLGMAVANVEYRLSSQAVAPAAIEDVRCAMLYVVNNATTLHIDVNKIIFAGSSAGGHLALLAGLLGTSHLFDKDCTVADHFTIAAIVAGSPISDVYELQVNGPLKPRKDVAVQEWLGNRADDRKFINSLSPMYYVTKNSPPVFLTHGDADPRVPYQESVALDAKLTEMGVKHQFITIPGGGHGGYSREKQDEIKKATQAFLRDLGLGK